MARGGRPPKPGNREPNGRLSRRQTKIALSKSIGFDNLLLGATWDFKGDLPDRLKFVSYSELSGILFERGSGPDRIQQLVKLGRIDENAYVLAVYWVMANLPGRLSLPVFAHLSEKTGFDFNFEDDRAAAKRLAIAELEPCEIALIDEAVLGGTVYETRAPELGRALESAWRAWVHHGA